MRLIDADAYVKYCDKEWIPLNIDAVKAQPTVDAVPVVRCKDCKYLGFRGMEAVCEHVNIYGIIKPWDYCSRGEREEK